MSTPDLPAHRLDPALDAALEADAAETRRKAALLAARNARRDAIVSRIRRDLAIAWSIGKPLGEAAIASALAGAGLPIGVAPVLAAAVGSLEHGLEGVVEQHLGG